MPAAPAAVAHAFVAAINAADVTALRALMTEDHTFTDALGHSFSGADPMIAGWRHFLHAYPDYWIRIDYTLAEGRQVALFGEAGGKWRLDERVLPGTWRVAAAWLAAIDDGCVKSWSVFCDTAWATPPKERTQDETDL